VNTKTSAFLAMLAAAAVGAVAGCGSSTSSPSSAPSSSSSSSSSESSAPGGATSAPAASQSGGGSSVAACTLMSQSDAATITGDSSMTNMSSSAGGTTGLCLYADVSSGATAVAFTEPAPGVSTAIIEAALAQQAKNGSGNYQTVSGIGQAAYSETDANDAYLAFVQNNTLVVAGASSQSKSGSDLLNAVEQWAKGVVGSV